MASRPGFKKQNSAKAQKVVRNVKAARKGNPNNNGALGRRRQHGDIAGIKQDQAVSRAIDMASEAKVAAKLQQSGSGLQTLKDVQKKGKDINRDKKRTELKKREGRVEQKLKELKVQQEKKEHRGHE